ncbi:peroxidase [Marchantia polymorpha subsp. ruderalis]|uniref:peroxidase n=1 Tax=Marchantia polymorpha TaxID=3197 RepID=A0A2R6WR60_MARPO|nr:hypothetical protein MARPO_0064s0029 [Marchantia polymorpha]BBN18331.1 hypothetical protein Mp_8g01700 [Marchantia polymorpha subsp. ruderalis]|eukprot:PTQ36341.1 hypothetical protein MARPO_0064s0029 [Marchantia polymorpha]
MRVAGGPANRRRAEDFPVQSRADHTPPTSPETLTPLEGSKAFKLCSGARTVTARDRVETRIRSAAPAPDVECDTCKLRQLLLLLLLLRMGRVAALVSVFVALALCEAGLSVAFGGDLQYAPNYGVELSALERQVPVRDGLAWGYYAKSCPKAEDIVAQRVAVFLKKDVGVSPGLLRLIFHDCFVQGCDGSILLRLESGTELDDPANRSIRQVALDLVDDAKAALEKVCPGVVTCADIVVMAGRESVKQVGGPAFNVPLGRRDSFTFSNDTSDLPPPTATFQAQLDLYATKNLDLADLVALSGAHTLGDAGCGAFQNRLRPTVDPKLNKVYAKYLTNLCPTNGATARTGLDFFSPTKFDNVYYKNFATGGALLTSDQELDQNKQALGLVRLYASNQSAFFNQFLWSYIKMSQIVSSPPNTGEVRRKCSVNNGGKSSASSSIEPEIISMVTDGRVDI